jgi:hypothetical protein
MSAMSQILTHLPSVITSDLGRFLASVAVVSACAWTNSVASRLLGTRDTETSSDTKRNKLVWIKNLTWFVGFLIVGAIWASKIAGFVLSVAAVAGAILIVSKELVPLSISRLEIKHKLTD